MKSRHGGTECSSRIQARSWERTSRQIHGAVLSRLKAEFPLVVMKAGCLRALESIQFAEAMPAPPPPAPGAVPVVHARAICLAGVVHPAAARVSAGSGSGPAGTPGSGFGFGRTGPGAAGARNSAGLRRRPKLRDRFGPRCRPRLQRGVRRPSSYEFTFFTNTYSTTYVFFHLASLSVVQGPKGTLDSCALFI